MYKEIAELILSRIDLSRNMSEAQILELIDEELRAESKKRSIDISSREKIRQSVYRDIRQLGLLQSLIEDSSITEIMVNGTEGIFIERNGKLSKEEFRFESRDKLRQVIWQITGECNRVVNDASPIVDARLKDGARVNIVLDPVALNGPILTIRRFPPNPITMEDYLRLNTLSPECSEFLKKVVKDGLNVLVSGATASGKTTFLNVLAGFIPQNERVITIEDSAELQIRKLPNLVRMETRNANVEGCKEITIRDLIKTSLRMRPDRIIVGEVRSKEAIDMLQSINVGHSAMTTVHANSVRDVVSRIETMVLMGMEMPVTAIRGQIASGFDLMVHLERTQDGKRRVAEIAQPVGMKNQDIVFNTIFINRNGSLEKVGVLKTTKAI